MTRISDIYDDLQAEMTTYRSYCVSSSTGRTTCRVVDHGGGVLTPRKKNVGEVAVCFDPLKCRILSFRTVVR